ncbi:GGDEF domain-containing protein [Massilia phyllosphaerae]|uniref:GGDEF domain-containing protein n=1 Tax=Massilia phyllosphaerae TaxID=3106034 RepID=UPI002B1CAD57|nr:GGDEF domain-containing protein [Massilia sp. SGZ-792]
MKFNSLIGEFADYTTESAFLTETQDVIGRQLRIALLSAGLFFLLFFATDLAAVHAVPSLAILLCARLTVALFACFCAWVLMRRRPSPRMLHRIAASFEILAFGSFMLVVALRPSEFQWHAMSLAAMLTVCYLYIPNRLLHAICLALGATAIFLVLVSTLNDLSRADIVTMGMLLAMTNIFGALAMRRYGMSAREAYRLTRILKIAAEHDHPTGCYNRRYLHEQLMSGERAWAHGHGRHIALLLCDIDHFKQINDRHGHVDGDTVLRAFGKLFLRHVMARGGSAIRYGGEEFMALLPDTDLASGVQVAESLQLAFAAQSTLSGDGYEALRATASFGLVAVDSKQAKCLLNDMIEVSDTLLYRAKANGRNRVEAMQIA